MGGWVRPRFQLPCSNARQIQRSAIWCCARIRNCRLSCPGWMWGSSSYPALRFARELTLSGGEAQRFRFGHPDARRPHRLCSTCSMNQCLIGLHKPRQRPPASPPCSTSRTWATPDRGRARRGHDSSLLTIWFDIGPGPRTWRPHRVLSVRAEPAGRKLHHPVPISGRLFFFCGRRSIPHTAGAARQRRSRKLSLVQCASHQPSGPRYSTFPSGRLVCHTGVSGSGKSIPCVNELLASRPWATSSASRVPLPLRAPGPLRGISRSTR